MIRCVPVLGSWPCSSSKNNDLQSGEWSPFGPQIAGFGTGLGWHMEPTEDTGSRGGFGRWENGDNGKPRPHFLLSPFSSVWTTCILRPYCGWPGCCWGALALAGQPALWPDSHLWRFPHQWQMDTDSSTLPTKVSSRLMASTDRVSVNSWIISWMKQ